MPQKKYYHHILHWRELSVLHNSSETFQFQRACGEVSGPNPPCVHYYIYQYRTHTHQQPIPYSTAHIYCYVLPHLLIFAIIFARAAPQARTDTRLHPAIFSTQVHWTLGAMGKVWETRPTAALPANRSTCFFHLTIKAAQSIMFHRGLMPGFSWRQAFVSKYYRDPTILFGSKADNPSIFSNYELPRNNWMLQQAFACSNLTAAGKPFHKNNPHATWGACFCWWLVGL